MPLQVFQISELKSILSSHSQPQIIAQQADIIFNCILTSYQNTEKPCFASKLESQTLFVIQKLNISALKSHTSTPLSQEGINLAR